MKLKHWVILDATFILSLALTATVAIVSTSASATEQQNTAQVVSLAPATKENADPINEPVKTETTPTAKMSAFYDVPLESDLQYFIIERAEGHGIDPAVIMAMCCVESSCTISAIGDNGNSLGLCQVQPRWHGERMQRLQCANLLDPFQNVTVAIDYLSELLSKYDGNIEKALVGYNSGSYQGTVTDYAKSVLSTAEKLR